MANHKVDMTEVRAFKDDINELMITLQERMDDVKTAINQIKQMDSFKGKAADEAKAYFEVIHETLLTAFQGMCSQLKTNVTKHVKDFQADIDVDHHTIITTGYIKDRKDIIEDKHDQFHELTEQVQRILSDVSDITNAHSPPIDATDEDKHHSVQVMKKLNNNIDVFATNYGRDEAQIENAMQEIKRFLDRRVQLGAIAATDSFTHALPQMSVHLAEAKDNVAFNRMLLSQEDRTRQNILGMKDSLVDRQGGLGAYGLDASDQIGNKPIEDYEFISKIDTPEIPVLKGEVPWGPGSIGKVGKVINNGFLNKVFKGIDNAIPNFKKATIDSRKLTAYALNPNHPVGGNKAKVFEGALGYNQSNASQLMEQIQKNLAKTSATLGKADQYGQRYTVDMLIKGPNGKTATVRTGWIIKSGSNTPEMTTLFVK